MGKTAGRSKPFQLKPQIVNGKYICSAWLNVTPKINVQDKETLRK